MYKSQLSDTRGTAIVETAMVVTILLALALGVVEFGNALSREHTITSLSREGANLAARGATLQEAVDVTMTNGTSIGLSSRGGVVATRVQVMGGTPQVMEQKSSVGYASVSRVGKVGAKASGMDQWGVVDGQSLYVVEVFYDYNQITPFGRVVNVVVPSQLYERAVF